jgi:hypothetical protein
MFLLILNLPSPSVIEEIRKEKEGERRGNEGEEKEYLQEEERELGEQQ